MDVAVETATVVVNDHIIGQSLEITLIGVVILFASLFLLWGVMELLVRVIKDPVESEEAAETEMIEVVPQVLDDTELKMRAAAAAVASIQNYDLKMKVAAAAAAFAVAGTEKQNK